VDWNIIKDASIGVVAIACLFGVVRMFMAFLTNHMSKHTAALNNLVVKTQEMMGKVDSCPHKDKEHN